jgi:hypothetical protein
MTSPEQIRVQVLMTGDAGIGPNVKAAQVPHSGADTRGVSPVPARVPAQPRPGCAVTIFAGDAFIRLHRFVQGAGACLKGRQNRAGF